MLHSLLLFIYYRFELNNLIILYKHFKNVS